MISLGVIRMRLVIFLSLFSIGFLYLFLLTESAAMSIYGSPKGKHGRDCMFLDAYFTVHEFHVSGKQKDFGIHGCPVFYYLK